MSSEVILPCGRVRIVFRRRGDRWTHCVQRQSDAAPASFTTVLESVDGDGEDDWPPSPPLQHLHVEERPEGQVALLVGMAGTSHWSASVSSEPAAERLTLDIACRTSAEPRWLGSTYRRPAGENGPSVELVPLATADQPACVLEREAGEARLSLAHQQATGARTLRWRYTITLE